jgi:hypothetical protein
LLQCSVILTSPNLHFFVAICQFSVIDAFPKL